MVVFKKYRSEEYTRDYSPTLVCKWNFLIYTADSGVFLRLYYFFQTGHLSHYILSRVQVVLALALTFNVDPRFVGQAEAS